MYRIRTVCEKCREAFEVKFTETGALEEKTYQEASGLCEELGALRSRMTYKGVDIPDIITCPKCGFVFPRRRRDYSVYVASIIGGIVAGRTKRKPTVTYAGQKALKKHIHRNRSFKSKDL